MGVDFGVDLVVDFDDLVEVLAAAAAGVAGVAAVRTGVDAERFAVRQMRGSNELQQQVCAAKRREESAWQQT
jgi:hypothetical protein